MLILFHTVITSRRTDDFLFVQYPEATLPHDTMHKALIYNYDIRNSRLSGLLYDIFVVISHESRQVKWYYLIVIYCVGSPFSVSKLLYCTNQLASSLGCSLLLLRFNRSWELNKLFIDVEFCNSLAKQLWKVSISVLQGLSDCLTHDHSNQHLRQYKYQEASRSLPHQRMLHYSSHGSHPFHRWCRVRVRLGKDL